MSWSKDIVLLLLVIAFTVELDAAPSPFQAQCVRGKYPPKNTTNVPNYIVNLDHPPTERWNELVKGKGPQMKALIDTILDLVKTMGSIGTQIIQFVDEDVGYLADMLPAPYGDEIKGIAKASGLPLGEVVLYNIFYELFTVCTSIVAQDPSGKLFHARNLDFGLFMGWDVKNHTWLLTEKLRPLIVNVDFQKGGKTVFKAVHFSGYVGVVTGIKPNAFTLSLNERFNIDGGYIGVLKWLLVSRDIHWTSFLTRDTLMKATSYKQAHDLLVSTEILAPVYYILGGKHKDEGCIITRSRTKAVDVLNLNYNHTWYLLETNYDHWQKPFFIDDRRTPGKECMDKLGQKGVSTGGLFDILSSKPVLNKLTAYTALMQVDKGSLETHIQYCYDPCAPW